ncbi:hypothetical protein C8F01DRAFT_1241808 [Mycena amicta]|nr:hypothetical protein C8F01DRAFT_1241808 [Mycena amicta]
MVRSQQQSILVYYSCMRPGKSRRISMDSRVDSICQSTAAKLVAKTLKSRITVNRVTRRVTGLKIFSSALPCPLPPPEPHQSPQALWPSSSPPSRSQGIQLPMFKSTPQAPHIQASLDAPSRPSLCRRSSRLGQRSSKNPCPQPQALTPPATCVILVTPGICFESSYAVSVSASLAWFPFLSPSPLSPAATQTSRPSFECVPSLLFSASSAEFSADRLPPTTALRASPPAMALHPLTRVAFSGSFMCQVALRR